MTDKKIKFSLILPNETLEELEVSMVIVPGTDGDLGVKYGHMPLITTLRSGCLCIFENSKINKRYFVNKGIAEISYDKCIVLSEDSEEFDKINEASIQVAISQATDNRILNELKIKLNVIKNVPYSKNN